jgi:hypothetical protein
MPTGRTHRDRYISRKLTYDIFLSFSRRRRFEVSGIAYKPTILLETEFLESLHTESHIPATVVLWISSVELNTLIF